MGECVCVYVWVGGWEREVPGWTEGRVWTFPNLQPVPKTGHLAAEEEEEVEEEEACARVRARQASQVVNPQTVTTGLGGWVGG